MSSPPPAIPTSSPETAKVASLVDIVCHGAPTSPPTSSRVLVDSVAPAVPDCQLTVAASAGRSSAWAPAGTVTVYVALNVPPAGTSAATVGPTGVTPYD